MANIPMDSSELPSMDDSKNKVINKKALKYIVLIRRWIGIVSILFGSFLFLSCVSYVFNWQIDQSILDEGVFRQNSSNTLAHNWMGRLGVFFSELLINKGIGIASLLFSALIIFNGVKIIWKVKNTSAIKFSRFVIPTCLYLSIALGFMFNHSPKFNFLGGAIGYFIQNQIRTYIGGLGMIILLTLPIIILMLKYSSTLFNFINRSHEEEDAEIEQNVQFASVQKNTAIHVNNSDKLSQVLEPRLPIDLPLIVKNRDLNPIIVNQESIAIHKEKDHQPKTPTQILDEIESSFNGPNNPVKPITKNDIGFEVKSSVSKPAVIIDENKSLVSDEEKVVNRGSLYEYPTLSLLKTYPKRSSMVDQEELEERKQLIVETLENYKIKIDKIEATIGPTVTLYEIIPAPGIRISKIKNLEDDIALSLSALGIRIIAPMPGKGTIGIEVPNINREIVSLKEALASDNFKNTTYDLPIILGKTINNEVFVADLTKMPHLLVAGATGQGKSVGINTIISSILFKKHPADVKFVLVDPKKVELNLYKKIEKHFLPILPDGQEAIITDTKLVVNVLKSLCVEMDNRYDKLKDASVRNIKEYNAKVMKGQLDPTEHIKLPYIVLVIDELADLMMTAGKEVEMPIGRLAQLARAIGIHLIVATQRPSVNIITGTIKANFPARLAFRVTSKIDSRTILDSGGADQLVGMGDMLFSTGNDVIRLQCPFIDTDEVEKLNEHIALQPFPEEFRLKIFTEDGEELGGWDSGDIDMDPMFEEAARMIVRTQQGSTSMLQRRLNLGYNRAGRIMDQLEKAGVVGENNGSKPREVLISDDLSLEQFLNKFVNKYK